MERFESFKKVIMRLLYKLLIVHYHEYEIGNDKDNPIGYDIITTRGGYIRVFNPRIYTEENLKKWW